MQSKYNGQRGERGNHCAESKRLLQKEYLLRRPQFCVISSASGNRTCTSGHLPGNGRRAAMLRAVRSIEAVSYTHLHTTPRHVQTALELLKMGVISSDDFIQHEYPLEHLEEAILEHAAQKVIKNCIVY